MNKAFTLAEVLITLGIIGVVAALTMPALMASYQRMVFKQQFRKMYSTLSQAYAKTVYDTGGMTDCYHTDISGSGYGSYSSSECKTIFKSALEKNLRIAKICETKGVENGCLMNNQYKGMDTLLTDSNPDATDEEKESIMKNCINVTKNRLLNESLVYVLNDGSIIISSGAHVPPAAMMIDINGQKGPNKWGHDLFKMSFVKDRNNYRLYPSGCGIDKYEKGGITSLKMMEEMNK